MKIIVGLGNPGREYEKTRHNIGWLFLDYLCDEYNINIEKKLKNCFIGETIINGEKVVLAKPQTYMNLSGNAVLTLKQWYKVEDKDIIIIFDDIDIYFGDIRYKESGSGGTHNGMKNIVECLNTTMIPRIKIGIGGLRLPNQDLANFVLEKFTKSQLQELDNIFDKAYDKLKVFLDK